MKKINLLSISLAAIFSMLSVSIVSNEKIYGHANESDIIDNNYSENIKKEQMISYLIDEQTKAYIDNNYNAVNQIEEELKNLGVSSVPQNEIANLPQEVTQIALLSDDFDGNYSETDTNAIHQYMMDNGDYSALVTIVSARKASGNLYQNGIKGFHEPNYGSAANAVLGFIGTEYLGNKTTLVGEILDKIFNIVDLLSDVYQDLSTSTTITDLSYRYEWEITESYCFVARPSSTTGSSIIECISNRVAIDVEAKFYDVNFNGIYSDPDSTIVNVSEVYTSPMYCNTTEYFKYRRTGIRSYQRKETLKSFNILGPKDRIIERIQLLDPDSINQV